MKQVVDAALAAEGPTFCEVFTDTQQVWEPKSATKRLPDGTLVSPPLEDLAPFLPRESWNSRCLSPWCRKGKKIKNEKARNGNIELLRFVFCVGWYCSMRGTCAGDISALNSFLS